MRIATYVVLGVAMLTLLWVAPATSAVRRTSAQWYWSESYAERMVIRKTRIPCKAVFGRRLCNWQRARAAAALLRQRKAACMQSVDPPRCLHGLANSSLTLQASMLQFLGRGVRLIDAECIGTGTPDASGYRFSRFRCKVWLEEDMPPQYGGWMRIAVYVTGGTTFRWVFI